MSEEEQANERVTCTVLREAGYRRGTWLISDRCDELILVLEHADLVIKQMELQSLPLLPYVTLVREQRPDGQRVMYARPIAKGVFAFGGNWLWSNDTRFPVDHPIRIHDALDNEPNTKQ